VIRAAVAALCGLALGALAAAGLLWLTERALRQLTAPKVFEVEHSVIYLGVILGAGFGAVSGALAGLAGAVAAALRRKESSPPPSPPSPSRPT
jgi:hypothetical protein